LLAPSEEKMFSEPMGMSNFRLRAEAEDFPMTSARVESSRTMAWRKRKSS